MLEVEPHHSLKKDKKAQMVGDAVLLFSQPDASTNEQQTKNDTHVVSRDPERPNPKLGLSLFVKATERIVTEAFQLKQLLTELLTISVSWLSKSGDQRQKLCLATHCQSLTAGC